MRHEAKDIWLKAAVAGGLWASFEIIVGSMLHNLHLPFSGTILATFSVILMIAFLQIWKDNGIIWRAGIICGLMKSLSPSAVILGPMTGIMMEAVFMDLIIFLLGRNLISYVLAGVAALLSAILHKLISLFILYGTDLVTIYGNLFDFLKKQFGMENATARGVITGIILAYIFLGIMAAVIGYLLGKRASRSDQGDMAKQPDIDPFQSAWSRVDPDRPFRTVLLFFHLMMIPLMLYLINRYALSLHSMVPATVYIIFLLLYYRRIKYRLMKPFFWSQLLIMTLIAGLFWHPAEAGTQRLTSGFMVGIEMSLRAILIVSAFSALSVEIRNPVITDKILSRGMGKAYSAVSLAFNSLPVMLDRSGDLKSFIKNPLRAFSKMVYEAEAWLHCFQTHMKD